MPHKIRPIMQRFWAKVNKNGPRILKTRCWVWTACILPEGYGWFYLSGKKRVFAHRFSYERNKGPISRGLLVTHRCDNKPCIRPSHLKPGTDLDNSRDKHAKGRGKFIRNRIDAATRADVLGWVAAGMKQNWIAKQTGVCSRTVRRIVAVNSGKEVI